MEQAAQTIAAPPDTARDRAHLAWRRADKIRKLSDRLIGIGPFGLGIDGVLAWVPGAGTIYSVGAAGLLISEALQAGVSRKTLTRMAIYLGVDSISSGVPVIGWTVDTLFPGHAMAAGAMMKDIEKRWGRGEVVAPKSAASRISSAAVHSPREPMSAKRSSRPLSKGDFPATGFKAALRACFTAAFN